MRELLNLADGEYLISPLKINLGINRYYIYLRIRDRTVFWVGMTTIKANYPGSLFYASANAYDSDLNHKIEDLIPCWKLHKIYIC